MTHPPIKLLWIAPLLNHYKASFLARLNQDAGIDLCVFTGRPNRRLGHSETTGDEGFPSVSVPVTKERFGISPKVVSDLTRLIVRERFQVVLMPVEKKHLALVSYLAILKRIIGYQLVTYNHPLLRRGSPPTPLQKMYPRAAFSLYDRVIFYTKEGMARAVAHGVVPAGKARFANNTLNTENIRRHYDFEVNRAAPKRLLMIGRLVPYRRIDLLLTYFERLKSVLPGVELVVIGDGPEAPRIRDAASHDPRIHWRGAITDEARIAGEMAQAHAVLMPGHSGLSIVHAFAYGKPYFTSADYPNHPPEIDYLQDGVNGLLLQGHIPEDVDRIAGLLNDAGAYERMCAAAHAKAEELAVDHWCEQIKAAVAQ